MSFVQDLDRIKMLLLLNFFRAHVAKLGFFFLLETCLIAPTGALRGGIKKKTGFFSEKLRKGGRGVSPNPKFPYQKKLRFFWIFFSKGGGSHLFQKGVIIKN